MFSSKNYYFLMTLAVLLILIIPVGMANIVLGYFVNESPCTSCWWTRIAMILVGVLGIFVLRYGPMLRYLILIYMSALFGLYNSIRHTSYHVVNDIGQGFGGDIFGVHTYTWGIFVFFMVLLVTSLLSIFYLKNKELCSIMAEEKLVENKLSLFSTIVVALALFIIASNAFQAFFTNGIPPFTGKGNPERLSFNLARASSMWTAKKWKSLLGPYSLRGGYDIDKPYVAGIGKAEGFVLDPSKGPVQLTASPLALVDSSPLSIAIKGSIRGIDYDPKSGHFGIITSKDYVYYTDNTLKKVVYEGALDTINGSSQIGTIVDASFVSSDELYILGMSKTIFGIKAIEPSKVDKYVQWRNFYTSSDELTSSHDYAKLRSIRAHKSYTLAMAKDSTSPYLYLLNVPNKRSKKLILLKFDTRDSLLTRELIVIPSKDIRLKEKRSLDEFYITAMHFYKDKILAISYTYNTLLVINKQSAQVESAYALPKLGYINSMAIEGANLVLSSSKDGKDVISRVAAPF